MTKVQQSKSPTQMPGATQSEQTLSSQSTPVDLDPAAMTMLGAAGAESAPEMLPPAELSKSGAIGAWLSDKRFTAIWGIAENRNSWVAVDGVGWKKLANNSDTAVVALTMLAAHAKQLSRSVNYREEADGMIHETYVW